MTRQLTALEKYRITGTNDAHGQIVVFESLGIPAVARVPMGDYIIECVAHTNEVCACLNAEQWSEIRDENIGVGSRLLRTMQTGYEHSRQDNAVAHQQSADSSKLLDDCHPTEHVARQRRRA